MVVAHSISAYYEMRECEYTLCIYSVCTLAVDINRNNQLN